MIMTADEIREYLGGLVSHITFDYHGKACGVDPFNAKHYDMWCGDNCIEAKSIDEVMTTTLFDGKSLEEIGASLDLD